MKPVTEMTIEELIVSACNLEQEIWLIADPEKRASASRQISEILDEAKKRDQALREKQELIGV